MSQRTRCTPTVDGGLVYTVSRQGNFFCLDTSSGAVKWSKDFRKDFGSESPRWGFAGSPLIEKDWVLTEVNGKASVVYQQCCQGLACLGYMVLAFDPMGQGERTYYPGSSPSRSRLGADEEHTYPGRQMILKGITSTRLQTWDSMRSLDYLASHPLVDPQRLASTGQSGGGTTTMLLAAVDDRLAAAAPCCGNT